MRMAKGCGTPCTALHGACQSSRARPALRHWTIGDLYEDSYSGRAADIDYGSFLQTIRCAPIAGRRADADGLNLARWSMLAANKGLK